MALSLPTSCCCLSLRLVTIVIGFIVAILCSLHLVGSIAYQIVYSHKYGLTEDEIYHHIFTVIAFEYLASAQIIFSSFLIYGCIQEISCYVLSWLFCETAVFLTMVIGVLFILIEHSFFLLEDTILIILLGGMAFIVYSYYDIMKKPVAV